jgi:hypothetical protein
MGPTRVNERAAVSAPVRRANVTHRAGAVTPDQYMTSSPQNVAKSAPRAYDARVAERRTVVMTSSVPDQLQ